MCLVDSKERYVHFAESSAERTVPKPLGCNIDEIELPGSHGIHATPLLFEFDGAVDEGDANTAQLQAVDLIFHQGDEWRHHERRARQNNRRNLVAQRFATARRHDDEAIASGSYCFQSSHLTIAEDGKSEGLLKDRLAT